MPVGIESDVVLRIASLERRCRRQQALLAAVLTVLLGSLGLQCGGTRDVVEAKAFVLRDASGVERARFEAPEQGDRLRVVIAAEGFDIVDPLGHTISRLPR